MPFAGGKCLSKLTQEVLLFVVTYKSAGDRRHHITCLHDPKGRENWLTEQTPESDFCYHHQPSRDRRRL